MNNFQFFIYLAIIAGSTYLIRAIPFALAKEKIKNRFIRAFLYYIPYAVLTAMTIPAVFFSTGSIFTALIGVIVAVVMACLGQSLTIVAIISCLAVYIASMLPF